MYALFATAVLAAGIVFAWGAGPAYADNAVCFACHGNQSTAPTQTIAGKTVSLWVNPAYAASKHGGQECTACHGTQSEAHDIANRTYGSWARFSASASAATTASWNFWKVDGHKCVACHTDPEYAKFFASDHSTSWNMKFNPDGSPRQEVKIIGSLGTTYTANENYVDRDCGRCHMGNNCGSCHWDAPIIQNPKAPTVTGSLLDLWTDYSTAATSKKGGLSEYAIDWTANIATHDFRSKADLTTSNEVCNACHTGYTQTPEALFPDLGIFDWGPRRHGQTAELMLSGARGVHETLQLCTDCHKKVHDVTAPESMLQWRQDHDVNCVECHPDRKIMGVGVPHQGVYCTACHATEVNAILDPNGGGLGVPLVIPRVTKHLEQQGYPSHNLRRDVDCVRCHVVGGNQTGALPMSQIRAINIHPPVALPKATVHTPVAPSTMYRGHSYTIYGYVAPKHSSGYYLVELRFYKKNSAGHYVYHHHVHARRYYYSSTKTKYKATVSLPHRGRWRVRAVHSCAIHATSYSGYDYITVR
jgi:hypothetical protein